MKRLVDIDDESLAAAQRQLGTSTIKDTVNAALRLARGEEHETTEVRSALETLGAFDLVDREDAFPTSS